MSYIGYNVFSDRRYIKLKKDVETALKKQDKPISIYNRKNYKLLSDVLMSIEIEEHLFNLIYGSINTSLSRTQPERATIGELLKKSVTLKKLSDTIVLTINNLHQEAYLLNNVDRDQKYKNIDKLKEIHRIIISCRSKVGAQRKASVDKRTIFCALCWRLPFTSDYAKYSEPKYSRYFCKMHHSNISGNFYKKDRDRLISALKKLSPLDENKQDILYKIFSQRNKRYTKALPLYNATSLFAERGKRNSIIKSIRNNTEWENSASSFMSYVEKSYPDTYKQICDINLHSSNNLMDWFKKIIDQLDENKGIDLNEWTNDRVLSDMEKGGDYFWYTLDNILFRYQCVKNLEKIKRPRGPKSNQTGKTLSITQEDINRAINDLKQNNIKINKTTIAKELNISRPSLYKILKNI